MAKDFLNETHIIERHQPFGGPNSAFKATLNPSGGYLNIYIKIKYLFPMDWQLIHRKMSQDTFKKRLADMVENVWSGRYGIAIRGNNDNREVRVLPSVTIVEAGDDAHFTMDIQRMGSGRSYVKGGKCKFYAGVINYKPSALAMKIGYMATFGKWGHDRLIYRDAMKYTKRVYQEEVKYDANSVVPIDRDRGAANLMAVEMRKYADVWPLLPLRLTGYRLAAERPAISRERADGFGRMLKQAGAPMAKITIQDGGIRSGPDGRPFVKVEVEDAQSAFLQQANNFPIAAHEVGHMLGLADEYDKHICAHNINNYAREANIEVPQFSSNTSSLMSHGDKLLPYHYITFHETINTMAKNFREANVDGVNGSPTIKIQDSLLRSADPNVLSDLDTSYLWEQ